MTETNLKVLRPSRKKPQVGDVFAMQLPDDTYLFGRVILVDLPGDRAPMPLSNLIYIYRERASTKILPDLSVLTPDRLLLPPIFTNRKAWTLGYFETIDNRPVGPEDLLAQHCFYDFTGKYLDLEGHPLSGPVEPCGDWGLSSYLLIDRDVCAAVGIAQRS
jgi:hypothetical protein